jgi:hypothetical protein
LGAKKEKIIDNGKSEIQGKVIAEVGKVERYCGCSWCNGIFLVVILHTYVLGTSSWQKEKILRFENNSFFCLFFLTFLLPRKKNAIFPMYLCDGIV